MPPWASWEGVLALTLTVLALRVAYHLWLSPLELAGDEAHYWDWSRHLSLSYYSKGPGVAWAIWASTRLFGHAEWAVRLPSALASALAMLALARLGQRCSGGDMRVAFLSAAAFCMVPAFLATSMLMTIDMSYIACWSVAALAAWELFRAQESGRPGYAWAAALGLAIGVGFLFKYTILLLLPGLLVYRLLRPARVSAWHGAGASTTCAIVAVLAMLPVMIWNARHAWPTVAHLLGHLGVSGGDTTTGAIGERGWTPLWLLEFVGAQIGIVGPLLGLMLAAVWSTLRRPHGTTRATSADVFLVCCAAPVILVYLGVSLMADAEANWPIAGYTTLCVLVASRAVPQLERYRRLVREWRGLARPRPRMGIIRRKPETWWQIGWHWSIGYALVAGFGMLALPALERVPLVADAVPTHRMMGHRAEAERLASSLRQVHADETSHALVMSKRYTTASWMAYYLFRIMGEDAPTVTSATAMLGGRPSSYDYWKDTDPTAARWMGRTVHLVGGDPTLWRRDFDFERIETVEEQPPIMIGFGYRGPQEGSSP